MVLQRRVTTLLSAVRIVVLEEVMKKPLLLIPVLALAAGCVYPTRSLPGAYGRQRPMYPRASGPQIDLATLPVGRWDNVMMSAVGTPLMVLMTNGTTASGTVVSATRDALRLRVAAGEVDLAAAEVMRVDRLAGGPRGAVKDGARGAAFGAGVVGVLGLIAGHMPPPRLFAAGAIVGAHQNIQLAGLAPGATTIYLAEAAVPPETAVSTDEEAVPRGLDRCRPAGRPGVIFCNPGRP
jgi:hypothetical protein